MSEHAISHGNSTTTVCVCGACMPSTPAAIEAHMYPVTRGEWRELAEADPESDA
jgi:hypothetical protein